MWRLLTRLIGRQRAWAIARRFLTPAEDRELREHRAGQIVEHCVNAGLEVMIEPLIAASDHLPLTEEASTIIARLIETAYAASWQHAGQAEPEPQGEAEAETNGQSLH